MLAIEYLIKHTSCLYPGTVSLWVTNRVTPLPCTVIVLSALVIFSTRSKLRNRSIVEQLSNNITFLLPKFISLVWLCLNRTCLIIFLKVWLNKKNVLYYSYGLLYPLELVYVLKLEI